MTYREMAMDAGCTSEEEIYQMAMMLEAEDRQQWEDYWAEQAQIDAMTEEDWENLKRESVQELHNERNSELQMHGVD
jgi:hypothetical protein